MGLFNFYTLSWTWILLCLSYGYHLMDPTRAIPFPDLPDSEGTLSPSQSGNKDTQPSQSGNKDTIDMRTTRAMYVFAGTVFDSEVPRPISEIPRHFITRFSGKFVEPKNAEISERCEFGKGGCEVFAPVESVTAFVHEDFVESVAVSRLSGKGSFTYFSYNPRHTVIVNAGGKIKVVVGNDDALLAMKEPSLRDRSKPRYVSTIHDNAEIIGKMGGKPAAEFVLAGLADAVVIPPFTPFYTENIAEDGSKSDAIKISIEPKLWGKKDEGVRHSVYMNVSSDATTATNTARIFARLTFLTVYHDLGDMADMRIKPLMRSLAEARFGDKKATGKPLPGHPSIKSGPGCSDLLKEASKDLPRKPLVEPMIQEVHRLLQPMPSLSNAAREMRLRDWIEELADIFNLPEDFPVYCLV